MVVIGITGPIGHGKTTLIRAFQGIQAYTTHYESSDIITDLAQAWLQAAPDLPKADDIPAINDWLAKLLPILNRTYGLKVKLDDVELTEADIKANPGDYDKLFAFLNHPQVDLFSDDYEAKETYRSLLQWIGGYFVKRVDDGIWWNYIVEHINKDRQDGVSFCTAGGLRYPKDAEILKSTGAIILDIQRPGVEPADLNDMTERHRQDIKVDSTLFNNGDLEDLQNMARRVYEDVIAGKLQKQYKAVPDLQ